MALCRCKNHQPQGRNEPYVTSVEPLGYPQSSSICGVVECNEQGLIWLTEDENADYQNGADVFPYPTAVTKVKVLPFNVV